MGGGQIGHGPYSYEEAQLRNRAGYKAGKEDPLNTIQIIMSLTTTPSQRAWWDGPDTEVLLLPAILVLTPVGLTTPMAQAWLWAWYRQHTACVGGTLVQISSPLKWSLPMVTEAGTRMEWQFPGPPIQVPNEL